MSTREKPVGKKGGMVPSSEVGYEEGFNSVPSVSSCMILAACLPP